MSKQKKYRVVSNEGVKCPRCNRPSQIREHIALTERQVRQPFYYSKWFSCFYPDCKTTVFMLDEFKVWNTNDKARKLKQHLEGLEERSRLQEEMSLFDGSPE